MAGSLDFTGYTVKESAVKAATFAFNIDAISDNIRSVTAVNCCEVTCSNFSTTKKLSMPAPTYQILNGQSCECYGTDSPVSGPASMTRYAMKLSLIHI